MKWAVVMDFTDDMNGGIASIGRNMDCSYGLVRMFDGYFRRTYLRLLPPKEGQTVAVGVFRLGSIKTNGVTSLYKNMDRLTTLMTTNDNLRIMVALALLGPLHTSHEVVELVRIETLLIANAHGAYRLVPTSPRRCQRVGAKSAFVITCPSSLTRVFRVVQAIGQDKEHTRRIALYAPFVSGIFPA